MAAEVDKELAALRKEVYEARSLVIKTDNLLKTLHAELKAVAAKQAESERRHWVGHLASYVVFGVLVLVLGYTAVGQAVSTVVSRADDRESAAAAKVAAVEAERSAREAADAARARSDARAGEIIALLDGAAPEDRKRGLDRWSQEDPDAHSALARTLAGDAASRVRIALAADAWDLGERAYRRGDMEGAVASFSEWSSHAEHLDPGWQPERRAQAAYHLGAAYHRLGQMEAAVAPLSAAVKGPAPAAQTSYAYLLLGDALGEIGRPEEAVTALEAGLAAEPGGRSAGTIRRRLARLTGRPLPASAPSESPEQTPTSPP